MHTRILKVKGKTGIYKSDYITRTIEQFAQMLARLLFGARSAGQTITFGDLEELSLTFTGLTLDTLSSLGTSQLLGLYAVTGELDINKVYISARLLHQLAEQEGSPPRALALRGKALALLSEIHEQLGGYLNEEHEALMTRLEDGLQN